MENIARLNAGERGDDGGSPAVGPTQVRDIEDIEGLARWKVQRQLHYYLQVSTTF